MSNNYKFNNPEGIYYITMPVVYWIDVFTREEYCRIVIDSLLFCQANKGMEIFSWVIMTNHVHIIFRSKDNEPSGLIRDLKKYTANQILKSIAENPQESRKEWLLWMFKRAGDKTETVQNYQFWQHDSHPIELWTKEVIEQKIDYIHSNPVKAGFVSNPEDWKYCSAHGQFIKLDA